MRMVGKFLQFRAKCLKSFLACPPRGQAESALAGWEDFREKMRSVAPFFESGHIERCLRTGREPAGRVAFGGVWYESCLHLIDFLWAEVERGAAQAIRPGSDEYADWRSLEPGVLDSLAQSLKRMPAARLLVSSRLAVNFSVELRFATLVAANVEPTEQKIDLAPLLQLKLSPTWELSDWCDVLQTKREQLTGDGNWALVVTRRAQHLRDSVIFRRWLFERWFDDQNSDYDISGSEGKASMVNAYRAVSLAAGVSDDRATIRQFQDARQRAKDWDDFFASAEHRQIAYDVVFDPTRGACGA